MMTNAVAVPTDPMADFQAKLQERVRDDIRNLLPEEAVSALVEKAVQDQFFKPRTVKDGDSYYARTVEKPSWFVEAVVAAAQPIMKEAVAKAVAAHPALIEKAIKDYVDENKLAIMVSTRLTDLLSCAINDLRVKMDQGFR